MITWVVVDVWFEFRLGSSQSRFRGWDGPLFSHALACQFDAVGIVDKAIEDRVGDGRISDAAAEDEANQVAAISSPVAPPSKQFAIAPSTRLKEPDIAALAM